MRTSRLPRVMLALLILAAAVAGPPILSGYRSLQEAEDTMGEGGYSPAAESYASAARLLPWRADLWEKAGDAVYSAGDHERAIRLLTIAAGKESLSARGWDQLGSSYWKRSEHDLAISSWESGSRAYPGDTQLLDRLAAAYHQKPDYDAEEAVVRGRLRLGEDATAHYRLGLLLLTSDPASAAQEFAAAAALNSDFEPATITLKAALRAASELPDQARRLVVLGRGLALVQEWSLALRGFELATEVDSQNPEAWAWLGEAKQQVGQDGVPDLERALSLGSQNSVVHVLRGLYFGRQGKNSDAVDEYSLAAQIEPGNPALQSSLGDAYAASGDLVAALNSYQRATGLAAGDATYWRLLASFCADNSVHVLDIGLPAAQKAADLSPKDPEVLDALGWSYAQAGYLEQAQKTLLQAAGLAPGVASTRVHLAVIYLRLGANAHALEQLKLALHSDPSGPSAQAALQLLHTYFPSSDVLPAPEAP